MDVVVAAALGIALGAATGVPLGVVNLSVVLAATRVGWRRAAAIGVGGAIADSVHAAIAFVGLAPRLEAHRDVMRGCAIASAVVLILFAVMVVRGAAVEERARDRDRPGVLGGVFTGVGLTLFNPAPLAAWIAVAAALLPGARPAAAIVAAVGVGVGSAAWFVLLARLAARRSRSRWMTAWLPRVVAVALVGIAGVAVWRVL